MIPHISTIPTKGYAIEEYSSMESRNTRFRLENLAKLNIVEIIGKAGQQ
jgi:hypothetical protein